MGSKRDLIQGGGSSQIISADSIWDGKLQKLTKQQMDSIRGKLSLT